MRGATFVPCLVCRTLVRNAELRVHDQLRGQFTVRTCQARTSRLFSPSVGIRYYSVSMLFQHIRQPAGNQSCFFRLRICRLRSTACPLVYITASQVLLYSVPVDCRYSGEIHEQNQRPVFSCTPYGCILIFQRNGILLYLNLAQGFRLFSIAELHRLTFMPERLGLINHREFPDTSVLCTFEPDPGIHTGSAGRTDSSSEHQTQKCRHEREPVSGSVSALFLFPATLHPVHRQTSLRRVIPAGFHTQVSGQACPR